VSELIAAGEPEVVPRCYDSRPGDTDRYDNLATAFRRDRKQFVAAKARRETTARKTGAPALSGWSPVVRP